MPFIHVSENSSCNHNRHSCELNIYSVWKMDWPVGDNNPNRFKIEWHKKAKWQALALSWNSSHKLFSITWNGLWLPGYYKLIETMVGSSTEFRNHVRCDCWGSPKDRNLPQKQFYQGNETLPLLGQIQPVVPWTFNTPKVGHWKMIFSVDLT